MSKQRIRRVAVPCLSAILLLGAIDLGSSREVHDPYATAGVEVFPCTSAQPAPYRHIESTHPEHLPLCPFCLLQMQSAGAHLPPAAGRVSSPSREFEVREVPTPPLLTFHHPASLRGPPAAF